MFETKLAVKGSQIPRGCPHVSTIEPPGFTSGHDDIAHSHALAYLVDCLLSETLNSREMRSKVYQMSFEVGISNFKAI